MGRGREAEQGMPREGECPMGVKLLGCGSNNGNVWLDESTVRISRGYLRDSSRGKMEDPRVIRREVV